MGSIFLSTQFTYNSKVKGSQGQFGGEIGSADKNVLIPINNKSEFKAGRPGNYDFLAHDGTILASGKPFQTTNYNMYERMVTYTQGNALPTSTDISTN